MLLLLPTMLTAGHSALHSMLGQLVVWSNTTASPELLSL